VDQAPTTAHQILPFTLEPKSSTNEAAGLQLAGEVWQQHAPNRRLNIILFGDGEPNTGGGVFFCSAAKAAVKEADKLKSQGARICTIGFKGSSYDPDHLRELASSPSLNFHAKAGNIGNTFLNATQTITQMGQRNSQGELVIFVIDESGSMDEGTKKPEVEQAVKNSIEWLRTF
ncbi:MAG: VWA domain-containing protein, partial [Candidatus Hydrogenedentes bacterium]|nr:VWA domain-containing protein [Candidatus Hydrogenedentota bacterium]